MAEKYFILIKKCASFKYRNSNFLAKDYDYTNILAKFGDKPICYLSGIKLDYFDASSYQLDHFKPASGNGSNELNNMRLIYPPINHFKFCFTIGQFHRMAERIAYSSNNIRNHPEYYI